MPGIVGIISRRPVNENARRVKTMVATLRHESFYVTGDFAMPEMGVYAGWIADKNSFAANQIFQNEEKNLALIFSGECFADAETKNWLKQKKHAFSETGGDYLVHLYEETGENFFEKLNGVFSGLLVDRRQQKVFLFNDRYGMERIYWHENADGFYFASEAKALLRILPELREFDSEGVAQFLAVGCPLENKTLYRGIQKLPGGARWTFENGNCRRENYFSPAIWESQPELSPDEFENQYAETFKKILPRYFSGAAKIGIGLTGGLDTRMIMACRPNDSAQTTYTFTGTSGETLDDRIAARIAKVCGLEHELIRIKPDFFSDFATYADKTVFVTDGNFGVLGAHEIYFHRRARELAAVRLTGNFGSEVFRGISTFKPLQLASEIFDQNILGEINAVSSRLAAQKMNPVTTALFKEIPWNIFGTVAAGQSQVTIRTPYLDNELAALAYQTPMDLRKSSLPASRFVRSTNPKLSAIPTDRGFNGANAGPFFFTRRIFAEATFKMDYYYNQGLPAKMSAFNAPYKFFAAKTKIAGLHKYLHYNQWLREPLADYVRASLAAAKSSANNFFNPQFFDSLAQAHISGKKNLAAEINAVLTLESVERQFFKNLPRD